MAKMKILTTTTYYSEVLNKEFHSPEALKKAERDHHSEKKRLSMLNDRNNWVRLNCPSISELHLYILEWAKDCKTNLADLEIDRPYFTQVPCSHGAPIGKKLNWEGWRHLPTHYLGFKFATRFKLKKQASDHFPNADKLGNKVIGFHSGSGRSSDGIGFAYSGYIFIDDFPLIAAKYEKALAERGRLDDYNRRLSDRNRAVSKLLLEKVAGSKILTSLNKELSEVTQKISNENTRLYQEAEKEIKNVEELEFDRALIDEFSNI